MRKFAHSFSYKFSYVMHLFFVFILFLPMIQCEFLCPSLSSTCSCEHLRQGFFAGTVLEHRTVASSHDCLQLCVSRDDCRSVQIRTGKDNCLLYSDALTDAPSHMQSFLLLRESDAFYAETSKCSPVSAESGSLSLKHAREERQAGAWETTEGYYETTEEPTGNNRGNNRKYESYEFNSDSSYDDEYYYFGDQGECREDEIDISDNEYCYDEFDCRGEREEFCDGCVCDEGLFRSAWTGDCVEWQQCRMEEGGSVEDVECDCGRNEECVGAAVGADFCIVDEYCDGSEGVEMCARDACVCLEGFVRTADGKCVDYDDGCEKDSGLPDSGPNSGPVNTGPDAVTQSPVSIEGCGIQSIKPSLDVRTRIIGGTEAVPHSWPWLVSLVDKKDEHKCGGSIIDERFVLTAGHCVTEYDAEHVFVTVGSHSSKRRDEIGEVRHKIAKIKRHEKYGHATTVNDIALIKLERPIKYSRTKTPLCLPPTSKATVRAGTKCVVSGWGVTEKSFLSDVLKQIHIPVISDDECRKSQGYEVLVDDAMFCAYGAGKDACQGDSGGPLMCKSGDHWEQQGIVSWGIDCGKNPGVYTQVTSYLDWIAKAMKEM